MNGNVFTISMSIFLQQMTIFHDLLLENNMTLVTSAVATDNADIKSVISRLLVSNV